jgi:ketosteroid isomerase-like protein
MGTYHYSSTNVNAMHCDTHTVDSRDSAAELEKTIERYNDAWNAQDVETILTFHAPGMVFQNHTAGDVVAGDAVGPHIAGIFERNPDLRFTGRRLYVRDGLVVSEWTATATNRAGQRVEWDGIDVFPFENGLILRKDVYSSSHAPRSLDE